MLTWQVLYALCVPGTMLPYIRFAGGWIPAQPDRYLQWYLHFFSRGTELPRISGSIPTV